jgi:hypothetical protein
MGNTLSELDRNELRNAINELNKLEFNTLDIQDRRGVTGYIDFINPKELNDNNVMSGVDYANRPFFVIKAEIVYSDKTKINTFTTFFQRYSDDTLLWHTAGHYGKLLFDTTGGSSLSQFKLLSQLLLNGFYNLEKEDANNLRIFNNDKYYTDDDSIVYPKTILLGYS